MERAARLIRICCWAGALTDLGAAVQMLSPRVFAFAYRPAGFAAGADFRFAMGMGASLMIGWTVLLLWAARRPLERKGILPLTVVPVIVGLAANQGIAVARGFMPLGAVVPVWVLQLVLSAAFIGVYLHARALERR